jgi:GT2 family glycosyltransferase
MNVTVVTVTYGRRAALLTQVLAAARAQGAAGAIVIDNGSEDPLDATLGARFGGWARIHSLGANRGSAVGFATGIAQAMAAGAEFILLLDDDNLPAASCLQTMLSRWATCKDSGESPDNFAVHATRLRADESPQAAWLQIPEPRRGSFLGFHIAEMPYKLLRRLAPRMLGVAARKTASVTDISVAPYGGTLFHRDVIARIGLPDEAFFLYGDDYEFSARLTARNGKIHLLRDAVIRDIDTTWGGADKRHRGALFTGRLEMQNPSKLYYATRNLTFFETYVRPRKTAFYLLNKIVFMTILTALALVKRKLPQYRTILRGMKDGREKCLGMNEAYQL